MKLSLFKRTLAISAAVVLVHAAPVLGQSAPANKCSFYEHFDYGGRTFDLHNNHVLSVGEDVAISHEDARRARGDYQKFVDPSWRGTISAVKVGPSCMAQMSFGDGSSFNVQKDAPKMSGKFNDAAVFVSCNCK